jgi:ribosomal protein L1
MLKENLEAAVKQIMALKPASLKGKLFRKVSVAAAMGPGIRLDTNDIVSE